MDRRDALGRSAAAAGTAFAAGAAAVLTTHQATVWALHRAGAVPWPAYSWAPTRPLGVPQVMSAAFWGGVWWVALAPTVARGRTPGARAGRAAALGAVLPTAVGLLLVALGRGAPTRGGRPAALLVAALAVNGLWGLTAVALNPARRSESA